MKWTGTATREEAAVAAGANVASAWRVYFFGFYFTLAGRRAKASL